MASQTSARLSQRGFAQAPGELLKAHINSSDFTLQLPNGIESQLRLPGCGKRGTKHPAKCPTTAAEPDAAIHLLLGGT